MTYPAPEVVSAAFRIEARKHPRPSTFAERMRLQIHAFRHVAWLFGLKLDAHHVEEWGELFAAVVPPLDRG